MAIVDLYTGAVQVRKNFRNRNLPCAPVGAFNFIERSLIYFTRSPFDRLNCFEGCRFAFIHMHSYQLVITKTIEIA